MHKFSIRDSLQMKRHANIESKGMKKGICKCKWEGSRGNNIYIKQNKPKKTITRDNKSHYIIIKWLINREDIIPVNIYAPNIKGSKYIKQLLTYIKADIHSNTIISRGLWDPIDTNEQIFLTQDQHENSGLK